MSDIPEDIRATALALSLCHKEPRGCIHPDHNSCEDGCEILESFTEALMAERERAAKIADRWEGKPCGHAQGWTHEEGDFYDAGQIDASTSIAAAIRSPDKTPTTSKDGW